MVSIAALPKCYLEDITEGRMSLEKWIDLSVQLECDGLELYSGFLKSHEPTYLRQIRQRIEDGNGRQKEIDKQIEINHATAELGGSFCRTLSGQARPEVAIEEGVDWVVQCIEACLPAAEKWHKASY